MENNRVNNMFAATITELSNNVVNDKSDIAFEIEQKIKITVMKYIDITKKYGISVDEQKLDKLIKDITSMIQKNSDEDITTMFNSILKLDSSLRKTLLENNFHDQNEVRNLYRDFEIKSMQLKPKLILDYFSELFISEISTIRISNNIELRESLRKLVETEFKNIEIFIIGKTNNIIMTNERMIEYIFNIISRDIITNNDVVNLYDEEQSSTGVLPSKAL